MTLNLEIKANKENKTINVYLKNSSKFIQWRVQYSITFHSCIHTREEQTIASNFTDETDFIRILEPRTVGEKTFWHNLRFSDKMPKKFLVGREGHSPPMLRHVESQRPWGYKQHGPLCRSSGAGVRGASAPLKYYSATPSSESTFCRPFFRPEPREFTPATPLSRVLPILPLATPLLITGRILLLVC